MAFKCVECALKLNSIVKRLLRRVFGWHKIGTLGKMWIYNVTGELYGYPFIIIIIVIYYITVYKKFFSNVKPIV